MDFTKHEVCKQYISSKVYLVTFVRYDSAFQEHQLSTVDILRYRAGVCREFVKIFEEMCKVAGILVKNIQGFAKGPDYKPGNFSGFV